MTSQIPLSLFWAWALDWDLASGLSIKHLNAPSLSSDFDVTISRHTASRVSGSTRRTRHHDSDAVILVNTAAVVYGILDYLPELYKFPLKPLLVVVAAW